ncbi:replication factor-A protein 1 [Endogone sp. FLAS-F59071]|nr:replication factor-A protein 1 [Endogone sp. FLAS-F59071]|eukprot:RUS18781.1 replication factor-A protein 1 [Endogone sp. FLAS-F59071]
MADSPLHTGCIKTIYETTIDNKLPPNPIVQVLNIKPIIQNPAAQQAQQAQQAQLTRIRLILSDGVSFMNAMLGSQLNDLVTEKKIVPFSIVRLVKYISNRIGNRSSSLAQRSMSDLSANIFPIKSLNPYQNKWTIKARVTQKSNIRHWSNPRGEGKLFSVNLLDETGEIKATIFQEQVDKFYELLEEKKVYYITKAKVGMARKQFSTLTNDYELTFELGTEVTPCFDDDLPVLRYSFVQLAELGNIEKDVIVVKLTLWDRFAEMFDSPVDSVVAFKAVKVSDYNGRSLSLVPSGMVVVDPDTPEGIKLRGWYDSVGRTENFLTHSGLSANSFGSGTDFISNVRKTLSQVKEEGLGMGEKDFFTTKATVIFFKQENFSYPACKDCKKKVIDEGNGWRCEKCQRTWPAPDHRYIMSLNVSDPTGAIWMSAFEEVGEKLLGHSANEMMSLKVSFSLVRCRHASWEDVLENRINPQSDTQLIQERDEEEKFRAVFSEANFKSYIFKCRAKNETFNDTSRVRYSIISAEPVDIIKEGNELAALIEQYDKL